jgi:hypothetical protein
MRKTSRWSTVLGSEDGMMAVAVITIAPDVRNCRRV